MTFTWADMLPLFFMGVMGLALLAYVVLDGYDLGVGVLLPFATDDEKDLMIASIGPFWDANETWLVLGIGVLLVAFPLAHGIVLSALYLPVAVMLVGLILRGVVVRLPREGTGRAQGDVERVVRGRLADGRRRAGLDARALPHRLRARHPLDPLQPPASRSRCPPPTRMLGAGWLMMKTREGLREKATGGHAPRCGRWASRWPASRWPRRW